MDLSRREFMLVGTSSLLALDGSMSQQVQQDSDTFAFQGVADLIGPANALPDPDDEFFDDKIAYAYRYTATDTGEVSEISHEESTWTQLETRLKPYDVSNLPNSAPVGQIVFDEDRGVVAWWDRDHWEWPNFVDDVLTTPQTVANTTTRTIVWDPDINPDSLIKGRAYQIDLHGVFSTANTSDQFTVDVNLAGTDAAELQNVAANVTDAPFTLETNFAIREDGENGFIKPNTRGSFNNEPRSASHDEIAVDTTTLTNISVALQWDAADPNNTVTLEQAHFKQMG